MPNANDQKQQKCPACGAPVHYDPKTGKLVCDYCGTVCDIEEVSSEANVTTEAGDASEVPASEASVKPETTEGQTEPAPKPAPTPVNPVDRKERDQILKEEREAKKKADKDSLPIYLCKSCGAELIAESKTISLTCPYCKNNIVLTDKVAGSLRPDGVLPFRITPDKLAGAVQNFYKGKALLPKGFFSESSIGKVTGLYVPFWVYDCSVEGMVEYEGSKEGPTVRQGDYLLAETRYYQLLRDISLGFHSLPIDASEKVDDALMDSIEPFDLNEVKPFDLRYLSGYVSERFDQTSDEVQKRANQRLKHTAADISLDHATSGFLNPHVVQNHLEVRTKSTKYLLLPVYMFDVKFRGESYSFAVNGQTGKVAGKLPIDPAVSREYFLKRFAAGAAATAAAIFALFVL